MVKYFMAPWVCVKFLRAFAQIFLVVMIGLGLGGCATSLDANPKDPWEPMNRKVFQINDAVDHAVVKPVAVAYKDYTPDLLQKGVHNFFSNLRDFWSTVNSALQLKGGETVESGARFVVNSTVGVLGLIDVASPLNLNKYREDFGKTLGYWGVPSGPYVVLPFFGPSTLRDATGFVVDVELNPTFHNIKKVPVRNSLFVVNAVDVRKNLLGLEDNVNAVALDKYSFIRDTYLQRRLYEIYDGNPPDEEEK
jgi:phospholipid-binding lipoprotein MlaA